VGAGHDLQFGEHPAERLGVHPVPTDAAAHTGERGSRRPVDPATL
jgi:hypothetical protein